ncbi:dihydrofolate reductase [Luteimonas cucumeris]|uniref:Dihydrofolate reductase n=1 Tax=Luteimonas cucumeris TaxID=985012 RepID=A0A562L7R3_9GAMM|nr:dihydrofolate reductase family protein [Luteimonas cucumeris]TWI03661.1 dihydrofolate reductase [Luteimonas cucumeris]
MGKVALHFSMSLDGCVAGPDVGVDLPMGAGGERLHDWLFADPKADVDQQVAQEMRDSIGATVTGRRTFDVGIGPWGDTPHRAPCFVVTQRPREPLPQASGTFFFVDDGVETALRMAKEAAQERDVVVMGAAIARQTLDAGLVDEINLQLVPILLGDGPRLFEGVAAPGPGFELVRALRSPQVMHLRYRVVR